MEHGADGKDPMTRWICGTATTGSTSSTRARDDRCSSTICAGATSMSRHCTSVAIFTFVPTCRCRLRVRSTLGRRTAVTLDEAPVLRSTLGRRNVDILAEAPLDLVARSAPRSCDETPLDVLHELSS